MRIFRSGGALDPRTDIPFELLLAHVRDGVLCADADARVRFANRAAEELLGSRPGELIGTVLHDAIAPHDRERFANALHRARTSGEQRFLAVEAIRPDGRTVAVEIALSVLEVSGARLVVANLRDVSARAPIERQHASTARERTRLARILDHLPEGILIRFADGGVLVNRASRELMGWPEAPERGTWPFHGLLYDAAGEMLPATELPLARSLSSGPVHAEYGFLRRDGSFGTLLVNAAAVAVGDEGEIAIAVFQDITDRKELERRDRILSDVTRMLLEHAGPDEVEPLQRIVSLVVETLGDWCAFSLIDDDGLLAQVAADHPDPRQRDLARRLRTIEPPVRWEESSTADVLRSGEARVIERLEESTLRGAGHTEEALAILRELGVTSVIVAPMRAAGTTIGQLALVGTAEGSRRWGDADVTFASELADRAAVAVHNARLVRKLADERAQLAAARDEAARRAAELLAVFDASPDGIVIYDASDRLRYVSARLTDDVGIPAQGMMGARYEELLARYAATMKIADLDAFLRRTAATFEDRTLVVTDEVHVLEPAQRWYRRTSSPVRAPDGTYLGRVFVYVDVTQLRALDRMRTEFLSVASHELKTPLTPLSVDLQMLARQAARGQPGDPALTSRALRQVARLGSLIDDLLELSLIEEAAPGDTQRDEVDLRALAAHVVESLRPQLDGHDLALAGDAGPALVMGDTRRLDRVLRNLIRNGLKYSAQGTTVVVRMQLSEAEVCVSVCDRGIGIPADEQPRLFERYFRASNAAARHYGGLGIGLYMSHEIVRQHGGRFEVESVPGEGSTFRFCIPRAGAGAAPAREP